MEAGAEVADGAGVEVLGFFLCESDVGAAESFRLREPFGADGGAGELAGDAAVLLVAVEKALSEAGWE